MSRPEDRDGPENRKQKNGTITINNSNVKWQKIITMTIKPL